jgi:hypothetical protein
MLLGEGQLFLRQGISEVHDGRDEPTTAYGAIWLSWHRPLGAKARTPNVGVPSRLFPGVRPRALRAAHELPVAVQLGQELGAYAGTAVEVIRVLGDKELQLAQPLQLDEREVGFVWRDLVAWNAPPWGWQTCVTARPDTIGAAEVGDAGVGANAGAREGDDALGGDDPTRDLLYLPFATDDLMFSF